LVLIEPMGGEDSGLSKQEQNTLDIEEYRASKALSSKKFIQTALGKLVDFAVKIAGWYAGIKTYLGGWISKLIPGLGEFLKSGQRLLKPIFGFVASTIGSVNLEILLYDFMQPILTAFGVPMSTVTDGILEENKADTKYAASLSELSSGLSKDNKQTVETLDKFGKGMTSFASSLDADPLVESMGIVGKGVDVIDKKIIELNKLKAEIKALLKKRNKSKSSSSGDTFPAQDNRGPNAVHPLSVASQVNDAVSSISRRPMHF